MYRISLPLATLSLLILGAALTLPAQAQEADTTVVVRIELTDGSALIGTILAEDDQTVTFRTRNGVEMNLNRSQITRIERLGTRKGEVLTKLDPNRTRLLFAPTGRALPAGQGYLADYYIFFPFLAYGVGDIVTLAGGITLFPFSSGQLLYLAPKVTVYQKDKVSFSTGTLLATGIGDLGDENEWVGLFYGVGTYGSPAGAVTLGLAYGMVEGELAKRPAFMFGLEKQLSNRTKFVSENYLFTADDDAFLLVSAGIRIFGDKLATDLALVTSPDFIKDLGGFPFFPFVGFAYNFGIKE